LSAPLRFALRAFLALGVAACTATREPGANGHDMTPARPGGPPPPIKHVFVIVLENEGYQTTFGTGTPATYLADTMVRAGALLRQYHATGHYSLDNYISMISGIAPDTDTQRDCVRYTDFVETGIAPDGQPIGHGCVYPAHVSTIANQLAAAHLTWKGYMEDMGKDPGREPATCGHATIGAIDSTRRAAPNDQYAAKHDPFVYFHAVIDSAACQTNVVSLDGLAADLEAPARTPNFSFITPNLCHDGHDKPCADHEPGGLVSANAFLARWVPAITHAPAFADGGLLIVAFDEATSDSSACCNEPTGPNTLHPGFTGPGGGRVGAVLISPFIKPGTVSDVPYNHYSMLHSIEEVFGLSFLGYAGQSGLMGFGTDVYTNAGGPR
jgi:phospholipase C